MAERRKLSKRKKEVEPTETSSEHLAQDNPSPIEYEIAKYLRNNLPVKQTMLVGVKVDYFIACKAIDLLLDSKWAVCPSGSDHEPLFTTRESVVEFLDIMLQHKFFHRAKKIIVKDKKKKKDSERVDTKDDKDKNNGKDKDKADKKDKKVKKEGVIKEKKKVKLDMHMEQLVIDSNEPYVWIYEPFSIKTCLFGILLMVGIIAVCLFPLWPSSVRTWVYYLSIAVASLLGFIIGLALLKLVIFVIIWSLTFGRHHFWIFPNLTEDVGFFESFWPLYHYEYKNESKQNTANDKSCKNSESTDLTSDKKKKKAKKGEETVSQEELDALLKEGNQSVNEESDASENDSIDNNGFEIVNNKDVAEIMNLKL